MQHPIVIIDNDVEVGIDHIDQSRTYGGLIEGLPTDRLNKTILGRVKTKAKERSHSDAIYLIEPKQTPIEYDGRYPFGKPMRLPSITCIMSVYSYKVFRDQSKMGSSLTIIWFQDEYAFPIQSDIIQKIKEIPFREICEEFDH
jgi:hypothetical protein